MGTSAFGPCAPCGLGPPSGNMYRNLYRSLVMPETISSAREQLTTHVARFRAEGIDAEPVVFGDHRQAEAVLLPYATFELLLDVAE